MQPPNVGNSLLFTAPVVLVGSPPVQITAMSVDSTVLPYVIQADQTYTRLEVSAYGAIAVNSSPSKPSSGLVTFTGTINIELNQGSAPIQFLARNYDPTVTWLPGVAHLAGDRIVDQNGYVQSVLAATSFSGGTLPITFTLGASNDTIAQVTAISISVGNILTVTAANNFTAGEIVAFSRLRLAAFLNGVSVIILTATPTGFTASYNNNAIAYSQSSPENGIAGVVTHDGGVTWVNVGLYEISPVVQFAIIPFVSGSSAVIGPPSAITSYKSQVACRVEWLMPTFAGTVGTRVVISTDPAGINPPYVQYGDIVPVTAVSRANVQVISSNSTTSFDPVTGLQIITDTNQTETFTYNYVDIPPSTVNNATQFYALLSTVVQDPVTNALFESQQNGPLLCGFVNLSLVSPTDFLALQRKEDIAGRLIANMTTLYPNLDLSPRSELRDLLIDPIAIELSNASVREWFARCSTSVSAMSQIDDANGDGVSDDFNSSPIKQQISRAFGLNVNDTQTLIDKQFDILGEGAGLTRGGAIGSVVTLTFYSYTKPTQTATFPIGILCATIPDNVTPSLSFVTTGSAVVTPGSAASFYDPVNGFYAVSIPASCQTTGASTNAGAGTINTISSTAPASWNVTNLATATFGQDSEINSKFAARIAIKQIVGVDSGTRNGYLTTALATPGVVSATVVAAGDVEMLRDWDPIRQKHVFGCVDIYTQGTSSSQNDDIVAFVYGNSGTEGLFASYLPLSLVSVSSSLIKFQVQNVAFQQLQWPLYHAVELLISSPSGSFFLGVNKSQFDTASGYLTLDPGELTYQVSGNGVSQVRIPYITNLAAVSGAGSNVVYQLFVRLQTPLTDTPTEQPVAAVNSVVGQPGYTGAIPEELLSLIHTSDFLLYGGSNQAGDQVQVVSIDSSPVTVTITSSVSQPVTIDSAMDLTVDANGVIGNVLSVRSTDLSTLYVFGRDYNIAATGPYRTYGLVPLTVSFNITNVSLTDGTLAVTCVNDFGVGAPVTLAGLTAATFLNNQIVVVASSNGTSFTAVYPHADYTSAADTGTATGSAIQDGQRVVVSYNKFVLSEHLSFVSGETQTLNGTIPSTLNNNGFVYNVWLPESWNRFDLTLDGAVINPDGTVNVTASTGLVGALTSHDSRYVKVTYNGVVMLENQDYTLTVNSVSGSATVARNLSTGVSRIPDGAQVLVSYFCTEAFDVSTEFPSFVPILANEIESTRNAGGSVLVKAMVANPVDITLTVSLKSGVSSSTLDPVIRTAIDRVLDNATGTLYQSEIISAVQATTGVQSVIVPLIKCAKSDGSYDIGVVIPTGTAWTPLGSDPAFSGIVSIPNHSFISTSPILPDLTVPSGGPKNSFVGLLYQGQEYARTASVQDFLANAVTPTVSSQNGSFYIIGSNDSVSSSVPFPAGYAQKVIITIPADTTSPSLKSYFVTYVVEGEGSAKDIVLSSTEYFTAGRVVVLYL